MAEISNIAWTNSTFNPWIGCTEVSPGCDNCYAREFAKAKFPIVKWGAGNPRHRTSASNWKKPLTWNKKAPRFNTPWRVFCGSLMDFADNEVPEQWRIDLENLIAQTRDLSWLLCTKRIGNVPKLYQRWAENGFPDNVRILITVCNQAEADRDIPKLLALPCKNGLSIEPMLGAVDIERFLLSSYDKAAHNSQMLGSECKTDKIDWVIVGAESGTNRRPFGHAWLRSIVEQCHDRNTPIFVKQDSSFRPGARGKIPDDLWIQEFPK